MKYFTVLLSLLFVNLASAATTVEETSLRIDNVNKDISITSHMGHLRTYPEEVWQVEVQINDKVKTLKSAEMDSTADAEKILTRLQEIALIHFSYLPVKLTTTETERSVNCTIITTTAVEAEVLEHDHSQPPIVLTGKSSKSRYDYDRCGF